MSCDVTLRARIATACAVLRGRPTESQRVDAMLTAIRATAPLAPQPATRPLAGLAGPDTRPLQFVLEPVAQPQLRTDTVMVPRIVLTASAQL